jgi:PmbA protein
MNGQELSPDQALEHALARAHVLGAAQADVLFGDDESLSLEVFEGRVASIETSRSSGLGIRVFVNGRPGYSFTERLTREAVERCARDAADLAGLTDPLELDLPEAWVPEQDSGIEPWGEKVADLGTEELRDMCLKAEARASSADPQVFNVPHLGAGRSAGTLILANSKGLRLSRRSSSAAFGIGVVAKRDSDTKMGTDYLSTLDPSEIVPEALAAAAVDRAISLLGARPIAPARLPVLFDERVSASLLGIFSGAFVGEAVQKGQSRLRGKEGTPIASPLLELSTMPRMPRQAGSRLFDGEGVPTASRTLVREGVLTGYLHNLESARRAGCAPTGDALRGYSGKAGAGFSNLVVAKGGADTGTLLRSHPRLLHVVKLEGASGCNGISGEISIGVQGFLVENGTAVQAVDRITVSGNFFDLLMSLEAMGNRYRPGLSGSFVPALLVSEMAIGG